jgi:hypothetical protein
MNTNEQQIGRSDSSPGVQRWSVGGRVRTHIVFAGLLTHVMVSILGAAALLAGLVAWFREVLPHEAHNFVTLWKRRNWLHRAHHESAAS